MYRKGSLLGAGSESRIRSVQSGETGETFALKCIPKPVGPPELKARFEQAARRWWDLLTPILLGHQQFPYFKESFETNQFEYSVMEVFPSDMDAFLKTHRAVSEETVAKFMALLLGALHQLHRFGCFHRDIKPSNLFLRNKDDPLTIVVGDLTSMYVSASLGPGPPSRPYPTVLGSSVSPEGTLVEAEKIIAMRYALNTATTAVGTALYLAPEVVSGIPYSSKVDIWSAGIVCFEFLFGFNPFEKSESVLQLFEAIAGGILQIPDKAGTSAAATSFLCRLLTPDPEKRPTAAEALLDPWIAQHAIFLESVEETPLLPFVMPSGDDDEPRKHGSRLHVEFEESTGTLFIVDPRLRRIRASGSAPAWEEEDQSQSTSSNSSDTPLSTVEDSSM